MTRAETRARLESPGDWGRHGSSVEHQRYARKITGRGGRCKCPCGCGGRSTHSGMANGVALMGGCELSVRRWVRDPKAWLALLWEGR